MPTLDINLIDFEQFIAGDPKAFNRIYSNIYRHILFWVRPYVSDYHWAEEIANDLCIVLLQNKEKIKNLDQLKGWIFRVTRNRCLNELRRRKFLQRFFRAELPLEVPENSDGFDTAEQYYRELLVKLHLLLEELSNREVEIVRLECEVGLTTQEKAAKIGVSIQTYYVVKTRILKKLRERARSL